jgi:hypothetical protein
MNQIGIFWPVLAQVLLVYGVYALIFLRRRQAIRAGSVKVSQFRENRDEPAESLFVRNNLANQFELPVLFYAACICLFLIGAAGTVAQALAWLFVASRYVHAYIHTTSNRIGLRQPAFTAGFLVLGLMWVWFALHLIGAV